MPIFRFVLVGGFTGTVLSVGYRSCGEVPERSNGAVSKTVVPLTGGPRVRIPPSPPCIYKDQRVIEKLTGLSIIATIEKCWILVDCSGKRSLAGFPGACERRRRRGRVRLPRFGGLLGSRPIHRRLRHRLRREVSPSALYRRYRMIGLPRVRPRRGCEARVGIAANTTNVSRK